MRMQSRDNLKFFDSECPGLLGIVTRQSFSLAEVSLAKRFT